MHPKPVSVFFPLLLVFYEVSTYLSNDMYLPALPQMMRELGLSTKQAQWTLTAWFMGQASMPLIMGIISDRFGRKPVLLMGGLIYIIATIACALTSHFTLFMIARVVEGGMVASMLVSGYACIHELYKQKEAIRILALMGSIAILAPALGPLLGSVVLLFTTWRGIFWIIAFLAIVSVLSLSRWMPETHPPENRQVIELNKLFKSYGRVMRNLAFMRLMLALGLIFGGWIAWITAGPLLVIESFHYSPMAFGVIQAVVFAAYIAGNYCVKRLLDSIDVHVLISRGLMTTLFGGVLALIFALSFPAHLYPFLMGMLIYSFGSALCFPPLNRIIIEASTEPMGIRVAMFTVFLSAFAALGSGAASLFFNGRVISLACLIAGAIFLSCLIKAFPNTHKTY